MNFIFYQNVISIHQSAFIKALSDKNNVTLVVEHDISEKRKNEGWNVPNMGKADVIINTDDKKVKQIIDDNKNSIHVFSGINAYPMVYCAFKYAWKQNCKMFVCAEPYRWLGFKGFLRQLKYSFLFYKYQKHINAFLATGDNGCKVFAKAGFPPNKLFEWGYFTEKEEEFSINKSVNDQVKLLFVGSIDERKNIILLTNTIIDISIQNEFNIIGVGKLSKKLKQTILNHANIKYIGGLSNKEVRKQISLSDILILPSIFDGWGAVVNEALQCGTRVIVSNNCGSSSLLKDNWRGDVFSIKEKNSLRNTIIKQIELGPQTVENRKRIIEWSNNNISGEIAAKYFIDICNYSINNQTRPHTPWKA